MVINNGGNFLVYGSTKTPFVTATADVSSGATSVSVVSTAALHWSINDLITIDTEAVRITSLGAGTINFAPAVGHTHLAATPAVVSDLSRNVLIESSGTTITVNSAYLRNLVGNTSSFNVNYGEFAYLGKSSCGTADCGVSFDGASVLGSLSSSTFHNGNMGIFLNGSSNITLTGNVMYGNASQGIYAPSSQNVTISNGAAFVDGNGVYFWNTSNSTISGNYYSGNDNGVDLDNGSNGNLVTGNHMYSNTFNGVAVVGTSSNDTISSNTVNSNGSVGILNLQGATNNFSSNVVYNNANFGLYFATGTNNTISGNTISTNTNGGMYLYNSSSNTLSGNINYSNTSYGMWVLKSTGVVVTNDRLGYDANFNSFPNIGAEIFIDSTTSASSLTLYATQVNPFVGISTAGFSQTAAYLISYNQNFATGTVRIYGDYAVSGSTFTLDYGVATYTGSGDMNRQKQLLFGASNPSYNNGRSKIEIASNAGFHAVGISTGPTLIDMLGGSTYYTFVASGAFTLSYSSISHTDENGIQLTGSGGIVMDHSTFDQAGSGTSQSLEHLHDREFAHQHRHV